MVKIRKQRKTLKITTYYNLPRNIGNVKKRKKSTGQYR